VLLYIASLSFHGILEKAFLCATLFHHLWKAFKAITFDPSDVEVKKFEKSHLQGQNCIGLYENSSSCNFLAPPPIQIILTLKQPQNYIKTSSLFEFFVFKTFFGLFFVSFAQIYPFESHNYYLGQFRTFISTTLNLNKVQILVHIFF
jgi:hypothetical protein